MIDICIPTCKKEDEIQDLIKEIEDNTPEEHRVIASCQPLSAAKNRNYCLSYARSKLIVMLDDDITGFFKGWLTSLTKKLMYTPMACLASARLIDNDGNNRNDMGMRWDDEIKDKKVTTACIAIFNQDIKFDENFIGSGYEDTDFMIRYADHNKPAKYFISNDCRLIHNNEMKNQGGDNWEHNHEYFCKKYPNDEGAKNQKCWVK